MDIKFAFLIECQEDGTPVGGKPISRLEEGSEDRDKLKIMAESGSNATKTDKLDVDLIDKGQYSAMKLMYSMCILKVMINI